MKSQAKVKSQRRIKNIPPFCDNPMSSDDVKLQQAIKEGVVQIIPNRRMRKSMLRQIKH